MGIQLPIPRRYLFKSPNSFDLAFEGAAAQHKDIEIIREDDTKYDQEFFLVKSFIKIAHFQVRLIKQPDQPQILVIVKWRKPEVIPFARDFYLLLSENEKDAGVALEDWLKVSTVTVPPTLTAKEKEWLEICKQAINAKENGQDIKTFCGFRNIPEKTERSWRKKLTEKGLLPPSK